MIGVSPAYFLSLFSSHFTPEEIEHSLRPIKESGFHTLQLETFLPEQVELWTDKTCVRVRNSINNAELRVSQFVAHHLLKYFTSYNELKNPELLGEFKKILSIAEKVHPEGTITIPQPEFSVDFNSGASEKAAPPRQDGHSPTSYSEIWSKYIEVLDSLRTTAAERGFSLAVEVLPGSLLGNSDGFLRMTEELGPPHIGINLDTGHAWACKENVALLPIKIAPYIYGTHLSDNFSYENKSLCPGRGSVPWEGFFHACRMAGYKGPFDVEIRCAPEEVDKEYSAAYQFLSHYILQQLEV